MKKVCLAIKYREDLSNRQLIEDISGSLSNMDFKVTVIARDFEKWGKFQFTAEKLMDLTFQNIESADALIVEFSEKGVGLGIEAGYAYSKGVPIIVLAKKGSHISNTLSGIATEVLFYTNPKKLPKIDLNRISKLTQ